MWWRMAAWKRWIVAGLALGVAGMTVSARADDVGGEAVTEEQVVASMQKGIDYLLRMRKGDNWEIRPPERLYLGGETALVLYSLLHAGESLQDNPDYRAKLHWRSKEMAPTIAWLSKIRPNT